MVGHSHLTSLIGSELIAALRQGGLVLIMRHPSTLSLQPDRSCAHPGNGLLGPQLSPAGCNSARTMGAALRSLSVRVALVFSSPAFRAREAVHLAGLGEPTIAEELDDLEISHGERSGVAYTRWLRAQSARTPSSGTNTLLVTHLPNLITAFPDVWLVPFGETLVFSPVDAPAGELVARIPIRQWPQLAAVEGIAPVRSKCSDVREFV